MKIRAQINRILRDLAADDEDISTYAAMSVLRLKEISEEEIAAVLPALRKATSNDSISVRFFAKKALNEVKLQMARYPRFRDEYDRLKDETKNTSWHHLLDNLENEDTDAKLVVMDYLRDVEDPLLPNAIMEFVRKESDPFVIAEAIKVLGILGDEEAIDFLEEYLSHQDSRIRSNAVEAMVEIGGKQVMRSVLPLLEDDDNRVKATVAKLSSRHGEQQVISTLSTMLHSVEIWMRESATYALGYVPYGESVDLLLEAVCDVNPDIQCKAIESLGKLSAQRARDFLTTIVGSGDPMVSKAAQQALLRINKEGRTYPYMNAAASGNLVGVLAARRRGKAGTASLPLDEAEVQTKEAPSESLAAKALSFISSTKNEDEETLDLLIRQRGEILEELGKKTLELFRKGTFERPFIRSFSNEEKKLRYLIEQKENQKKDLKDETEKSTFLSFIKESVSRFTQEKQVDSRMDSLKNQLRETYVRLAERLLKEDDPSQLDPMHFDNLPDMAVKLERQITAVQKSLTENEG